MFFIKTIKRGVAAFVAAFFTLLTIPVTAQETNANLRINASWGGGDILNLDIADLDSGTRQQVAVRLSDFIQEGENVPYILLQAMDLLGERQSGVIQIENPLFEPETVPIGATVGNSGAAIGVEELAENLQEIIAEANKPAPPPTLTPDGTGTVVDNIMTVNNIEFFTVTTDNGSDFFLVVDRQRTNNNVYLLNTVTEADLVALAEAHGETLPPSSVSAPTTQEEPPPTMEEIMQAIQDATAQNSQEAPPPTPQRNNNSGIFILGGFALFIAGTVFVVWKWVLPKLKELGNGNQEEIEEEIGGDEYEDEDYHNDSGNVIIGENESFGFDGVADEPEESNENEENGGDENDEK